jgi:hypothetical protein
LLIPAYESLANNLRRLCFGHDSRNSFLPI